jgi:hypothetical protein
MSSRTLPKLRRVDRLALGITLVTAAAVRFAGLGADPLWIDEMRGFFGQNGLPILREVRETFGPIDPPLSYVLLRAMAALPFSVETSLRILPAVCGVIEVLEVWLLLRMTVPRWRLAAPLGAALMALAPFAVRYSQEARYYTMASAFELGSFIAAIAVARTGSRRAWLVWVAISIGSVYTHVLGWYWLGLQVVALALLARRSNRQTDGALRPPPLRAIVAAVGAVVVGFLPWAAYSASYWLTGAAASNDPRVRAVSAPPPDFGLDFLNRLVHGLVADAPRGFNVLVVIVLLCAIAAPMLCRGPERRAAFVAWGYLLVTTVVVSALYRVVGTYFAVRRYEFLLPILLSCTALGVVGLHDRLAGRSRGRRVLASATTGALIVTLIVTSAIGSVQELARDKPDYRAVAREVNEAPRSTVIVVGSFSRGPETAWEPVLRRYLGALGVRRELISVSDLGKERVRASGRVLWITGAATDDPRFTVERLNDTGALLTISGDSSYGAIVTPVFILRSTYVNRAELARESQVIQRLPWVTKVWP